MASIDFWGLALLALARLTIAYLVLGCLAPCIYRWKLHPLSSYPGPWLAKVTDLYLLYYAAKGNAHLKIRELHQQYGPYLRIAPNKIVFASVDANHEIYSSKSLQKAKGYDAMNPPATPFNTLTCIDKGLHRQRRKILSHAFSEQALRSFEPVIIESVEVFLEQLRTLATGSLGQWSAAIDVAARLKYFTSDVISAFSFGDSFNTQRVEKNRGVLLGMRAGSMISGICNQYTWLTPFKNLLDRVLKPGGTWTREQYAIFMREVVKKRLGETKDARSDLFSFIIDAKDPETGAGLTMTEIWGESRMLMLAGTDTTATVLSGALFYLSRNTACYNKLAAAVRSTFSTASEIHSGPKLTECTYLRAVLDETMRLSPPIGLPLWREVCEQVIIDGKAISAGTEIGSCSYSIFHDDAVYPDALTFSPERWLGSPQSTDGARRAFHPFSLGSRKCIGQNMAYSEMALALAKLVWHFDFRRPSAHLDKVEETRLAGTNGKEVPVFAFREYVTPLPEGPYLEFRFREESGEIL